MQTAVQTDLTTSLVVTNLFKNKVPSIAEAPVLENYLDYRKFLADFYNYRREISKKDLRPYNYAVFSAAADIKSPNYLKMIIDGRRNLSEDMIGKFAKALGLQKELAEEFRTLVLYSQASDPAERNLFLKELNEKRVQSQLKSGQINAQTWEKIPNWISWILYATLDQANVEFEPEQLRKVLRNKASKDEIELALRMLKHSGEIKIDEVTGEHQKGRSLAEYGEEIPVALVRKLQTELMYLGLESLFQDSPTEREFGTATLSLTRSEFEELRFQLRKFRKETQKNIGVKRLSSKGEKVYQLNLQLYPVTDVGR